MLAKLEYVDNLSNLDDCTKLNLCTNSHSVESYFNSEHWAPMLVSIFTEC